MTTLPVVAVLILIFMLTVLHSAQIHRLQKELRAAAERERLAWEHTASLGRQIDAVLDIANYHSASIAILGEAIGFKSVSKQGTPGQAPS